jgi:hypothetical protein
VKHVVRNPYAGVDWAHHARCKASMHAHTTESDGTQSPAAVIDEHHAKRYDILALTDHDALPGWPGSQRGSTWPWTSYGRDPDRLGMLALEGNEFSLIDHVNGYFTGVWTEDELFDGTHERYAEDLPWIIEQIGVRGGLAQINHPGRYDRSLAFYLQLFDTFHRHLHAIEVFNQGDRCPRDRQRWDHLLTAMRRAGNRYPLWGSSVDDSHQAAHIGRNYHVYLLPDRDVGALREAMTAGAYWFVHDPQGAAGSRHDNGEAAFWTAAPMIERIDVTASAIWIDAAQYDAITWITDDGRRVHDGDRLALSDDHLGGYVRAVLTGRGGATTYTQPIYLDPV